MAYSNLKDNYSDGIEMLLPLNFKLLNTDRLQLLPVSDAAPNGWGKPFFDSEGDPINPPLGTVGGTSPYVEIRGREIASLKVARGRAQETGAYYLADGDQPTTGGRFFFYPGLRKNGKNLLADNTYVGDQLIRLCYIRKITESGTENTYAHFVTVTEEEGFRLNDEPDPDIFSHPEIAAAPHLPYGYYNRYTIRTWRKKVNDPDNNDPVLLSTYVTPFCFHDSENEGIGSRANVAENEERELIAGTVTGSIPAKTFQSNCSSVGTGYLCMIATWNSSCHYIFRIDMVVGAIVLEHLSWCPHGGSEVSPGDSTNTTLEFVPTAETEVVVNAAGIGGILWKGYIDGVLSSASFTSITTNGAGFLDHANITFPDGFSIQVGYTGDYDSANPKYRVWGLDFINKISVYAEVDNLTTPSYNGITKWYLRKDGTVTEVGTSDESLIPGIFKGYAFLGIGVRQKECLPLGHTYRIPAVGEGNYTIAAQIEYNEEMATISGGLGGWNDLDWYTIIEAPVGVDIDALLEIDGSNPRLKAVQGYV